MPNTSRGWFSAGLAAGQNVNFDAIASMIGAGSAIGGAMVAGASTAFPRASNIGTPTFIWDSLVFRFSGGSGAWTTDEAGPSVILPNATVGIAMFGNDPKPIAFPGHVVRFSFWAGGAGTLNAVFLEGDELSL